MLADSLIVPQCVYRPGTFTGLMTLYESSYIKLDQLTGGFDWPSQSVVSVASRDMDLHADILRREPYTTTLRLTYWFQESGGSNVADPDLIIRVYHDARLVEVVSGQERHRHQKLCELTAGGGIALDRRWRVNMTLNKWLDYLLEVGHSLGRERHRRA